MVETVLSFYFKRLNPIDPIHRSYAFRAELLKYLIETRNQYEHADRDNITENALCLTRLYRACTTLSEEFGNYSHYIKGEVGVDGTCKVMDGAFPKVFRGMYILDEDWRHFQHLMKNQLVNLDRTNEKLVALHVFGALLADNDEDKKLFNRSNIVAQEYKDPVLEYYQLLADVTSLHLCNVDNQKFQLLVIILEHSLSLYIDIVTASGLEVADKTSHLQRSMLAGYKDARECMDDVDTQHLSGEKIALLEKLLRFFSLKDKLTDSIMAGHQVADRKPHRFVI